MDQGSCGIQDERSPSTDTQSPIMDRNPSPPLGTHDGHADKEVDAIGETAYSKHWLFSTLTHLIQIVTGHSEVDSDAQKQLSEEEEEDLCRIWDMAMDKDVAVFLQEFKAADILLGVIAKSCCPRLTEICVGILGNMACFPDACLSLSQNQDLGAVLLLLLGDSDPPTILETSRLLLTCVSQKDVSPLWLERIRQQTSVGFNLCFIMCSSTNLDLLVKVGELVDKLFDLDEELMRTWITAQPRDEEDEEDVAESHLELTFSLLEAAKQLRPERQDGLEVYLHVFQLLTTLDEGIQTLDGPGKAVWDFLCEVVCEDLCQPDDPPLVLQEQKVPLVQALAVLSALYACNIVSCHNKTETFLSLLRSIMRVLQYHREYQQGKVEEQATVGHNQREGREDEQLQALIETTTEFLADIFTHISKDMLAEFVRKGYLTEKTCLSAAGSLLPEFKHAVQHLVSMLSETDPQLADAVREHFPLSGVPS